jgi:ATP-binding cassette subfamily F protein 3
MMFEGDDALKKISVLSGGERSRVLLGKILATPTNVLLLDEPTNHLDVESVMALTEALEDFDGAVVIVTHSEEILRRVATRLVVFQGDAPFVFEGTYDEFLDSIGWEGEEGAQPSKGKKKKAKAASNGEGKGDNVKRDKAQVMQERSRLVTPLRERVASLEKSVAQLEGVIASSQQALTQASTKGDGASIQRLSQELAQNKREVEQQMLKWEAAQAELETLEKSYEERLAAFAN